MSQRKMAWGLALLAGAAFFLARLFPADPDASADLDGSAVSGDARPAPKTSPPTGPASAPGADRIRRRIGSRTSLPRTAAAESTGVQDAVAAADAVPAETEEDDTAVLPEGGRGSVVGAFSPEALIDAMAEVSPDITDCVEEWQSVMDAELEGRLVLEMTLGPEGVMDAALVDVDGVPEPMLGCFGGIIYEAEWPLPEEVTDVAWPFRVVLEAEE